MNGRQKNAAFMDPKHACGALLINYIVSRYLNNRSLELDRESKNNNKKEKKSCQASACFGSPDWPCLISIAHGPHRYSEQAQPQFVHCQSDLLLGIQITWIGAQLSAVNWPPFQGPAGSHRTEHSIRPGTRRGLPPREQTAKSRKPYKAARGTFRGA